MNILKYRTRKKHEYGNIQGRKISRNRNTMIKVEHYGVWKYIFKNASKFKTQNEREDKKTRLIHCNWINSTSSLFYLILILIISYHKLSLSVGRDKGILLKVLWFKTSVRNWFFLIFKKVDFHISSKLTLAKTKERDFYVNRASWINQIWCNTSMFYINNFLFLNFNWAS